MTALRRTSLGPLLLITDRRLAEARGLALEDAIAQALESVEPGGAVVQLREKDLRAGALVSLTRRVLRVTRERRCPLLINDRVDVAIAAGADGAHLPEGGLSIGLTRSLAKTERFLVGVSAHSADGAGAAAKDGADLIAIGPIWETPAKAHLGPPLGVAALRTAAASVSATGTGSRLYALGGVDAARVAECANAGAHGVAAIRAWLADSDGAKRLADAVSSVQLR